MRSLILTVSCLALSACAPTSSNSDGGSDAAAPPTWYEHVAPIVYRECVSCHREGGIAPFSLVTYEQARSNASLMAFMTESRRMPPMPVNNDGSCNTYSNARWLSTDEIATIRKWSDAGAPAGDPARGPAVPPPPAGLPRADITLDIGTNYMPSTTLPDDYRCFVVDSGMTADSFLIGYEVVPGDQRVVHHVIVYQPSSDAASTQAMTLDAQDATPGYPCFGAAGVDSEPRVLWAPGVGATMLPANTGLPLTATRKQIIQIHYNTLGGSFPDRTRVRLMTQTGIRKTAYFAPVADTAMQLAPRMNYVETTAMTNLPSNVPITVYGALPHMHTLGRKLRVTARSGGQDTCLTDVDRWNFHWQNAWWYTTPKSFRSVDQVQITCGFDTSGRDTTTRWGESTLDEMCLDYLYVTVP